MDIAARVDDFGKPAWIGLVVLGFIFFWPVGLAVLAYLLWSGRMACWKHGRGYWYRGRMENDESRRGNDGGESWFGCGRRSASSGNRAFDEYRAETLRRLEEEQRAFMEFLNRLRFAKDKAQFDEFLAERRQGTQGPEPQPQS
jgi:Protein of unknown function (DUF2852)